MRTALCCRAARRRLTCNRDRRLSVKSDSTPSGRPAATGLAPLMQQGRHGVPKPRLMKVRILRGALGFAKTCGVIIRTTPRRRRPRLQALFFTRPAPAPFARIILRMVRLNAGSTPAPGTHAGMRQSVSRRTKTVQYVNDSPVRPHRSPACRGATAGAALEFRCSRFDSGQGHFRIPVSTPPPVLRAWGWAERWSTVHLYGSFAWLMPSSVDIRTLAVLAQRLVPQPSTLMTRVRFPHTARYDSTPAGTPGGMS